MAVTKPRQATIHNFGPYEFVPAELELREGAGRKALTPALNRLLLLLVTNPGELVTREQIAEALWESQGTVDTVAGTNVRHLRENVGAAKLVPTAEDLHEIEGALAAFKVHGGRRSEARMKVVEA
jgi:DNA-binding response OmpR family regulator